MMELLGLQVQRPIETRIRKPSWLKFLCEWSGLQCNNWQACTRLLGALWLHIVARECTCDVAPSDVFPLVWLSLVQR